MSNFPSRHVSRYWKPLSQSGYHQLDVGDSETGAEYDDSKQEEELSLWKRLKFLIRTRSSTLVGFLVFASLLSIAALGLGFYARASEHLRQSRRGIRYLHLPGLRSIRSARLG